MADDAYPHGVSQLEPGICSLQLKAPEHVEESQLALVVKNLPAKAGDARDMGLIPELGRPSGGGNGNPVFLPGKIPGTEEPGGL